MAANTKLSKAEIEKRAAQVNEQNSDFLSALSGLGSTTIQEDDSDKTVTIEESYEEAPKIQLTKKTNPTLKKTSDRTVTSGKSEGQGYVSLVIPNTLKTRWKTFCKEHGVSLTDCIKLGMKVLEDLEKNNQISIEDGIISYMN